MDNFIETLLIHYRWVLVCFILMPLSIIHDLYAYIRNRVVFYMNSAPGKHDIKVRNVQNQVKLWIASGKTVPMCTARPGWQTVSFRRGLYKDTMFNVRVDLVDIVEVDTNKMTVRLEPLVTMGQLTATLAPLGYSIPVLPEIDDLTVGGLVMGTGIETSSHIYGLFQHTCLSYELVLSDGSVTTCSKTDNPSLFYAVPWSYGTLGFLTAVEVQLVPIKKYVRLEYHPFHLLDGSVQSFIVESRKKENQFVEGILFNKNEGVIMTGTMVDKPESPKMVNSIGRWYKPWFFEHVRSFLKSGGATEYIPLRDYYHRHTKSIFWELQDIIPFGNNFLFRFMFGWALPPKISFLKLTQTAAVKKLYENNHIIQDMMIPLEHLKESVIYFDKKVDVYPIWLCPFKLTTEPGMVHCNGSKDALYVDIGIYGVPGVQNFHPRATTRDIEEFVRKVKGYQMLYADTYMNEEEFRKMFDHSLYDHMRKELNCEQAFPTVFGKVNKSART